MTTHGQLKLLIRLFLLMKRLRNLVAEATLVYNLLDKLLITVLEIFLCFRPADRPCRLEETSVYRNVSESTIVQNLMTLVVNRSG